LLSDLVLLRSETSNCFRAFGVVGHRCTPRSLVRFYSWMFSVCHSTAKSETPLG
jgi:hypothetical protein